MKKMWIINKAAKTGSPGATILPLSLAHLLGLAAIQAAVLLWFVAPLWAPAPLLIYLLLCLAASFVQGMQFYLPIITRGERRSQAVALTFDDGPDPDLTPRVLTLLSDYDLTAAFFVVGHKVDEHPDLVRMILDQGHEIGNHSQTHDVCLMCRNTERLRREIGGCQKALSAFNVRPTAFRPPVGVTNPRLWRALLESGMFCIGFACRGRDFGNRFVRGLSQRILKRVKAGDIILLHDNAPPKKELIEPFLQELRDLFDGLKEKGLAVSPLSQLIRRPVMTPAKNKSVGPVQAYFDSMAQLDHNRPSRVDRLPARQTELKLFKALEQNIREEDRILEVGAGTGRFTFRLASRAREVWAVEISTQSLLCLQQQVRQDNITNIFTLSGDVNSLELPGSFDIICSFSTFEYINDLKAVLEKLVNHLAPGGRLYFITAHRSFFRLFTQIGNAMRQGLWLHARSCQQVEEILQAIGLANINVSAHGMKSLFNGGLLLEASARKPVR